MAVSHEVLTAFFFYKWMLATTQILHQYLTEAAAHIIFQPGNETRGVCDSSDQNNVQDLNTRHNSKKEMTLTPFNFMAAINGITKTNY